MPTTSLRSFAAPRTSVAGTALHIHVIDKGLSGRLAGSDPEQHGRGSFATVFYLGLLAWAPIVAAAVVLRG